MMKRGIVVDKTGLASNQVASFNNDIAIWELVKTDDMVGNQLPDLLLYMQLPLAIPEHFTMPILINDTTAAFQNGDQNNRPIARFCGWNTMVERPLWEIAAYNNHSTEWLMDAADMLYKKFSVVKNEPGFIAARVVATIINEACFGLADDICSANDMDLAMQLGTNYPKGPVAWMEEIGKKEIVDLLETLAVKDARYTPHPLLYAE